MFRKLGWLQTTPFDQLEPGSDVPNQIENLKAASIGQEAASVSPLQMALSAASISFRGDLPAPVLTLAYLSPTDGWTLLPAPGTSTSIFSNRTIDIVQRMTSLEGMPAWGVVGKGLSGTDRTVTWFIGGTNNEWKGSPIAVAFVLEEDNPMYALTRGKELLQSILME